VSAAPGVPGVRVVAAPVGAVACPQALMDIRAAIGIMAIQTRRVYTVVTSCIQETCVSALVCTPGGPLVRIRDSNTGRTRLMAALRNVIEPAAAPYPVDHLGWT
jgi:hypothetical protein